MEYQALGNTKSSESTLRRLLAIEDSDYERVKGVPEMVDTTYARAHAYFGEKYLASKDYASAGREFDAAAERLERWRSNTQMLQVARFTGSLTKEDEGNLLDLLRDCYLGLSKTSDAIGRHAQAAAYKARAERIDN